ncbi:hypothetical protein AB0E64_22535 [Streptomyces caelestis]|uniref:Uncharacterized protein n=1 Tax=Streptomyces caelestis TaxID=36816 RepID=A0A7W9LUV5_9ACTN|nr:hypothetical protein [Streptomyces caelestis]MBB5796767.1 hypothetical protein [Streptomyces caelestis]GGW33463.1 hypothetical protein GCM10010320_10600 [Streptomyces caelestis]
MRAEVSSIGPALRAVAGLVFVVAAMASSPVYAVDEFNGDGDQGGSATEQPEANKGADSGKGSIGAHIRINQDVTVKEAQAVNRASGMSHG